MLLQLIHRPNALRGLGLMSLLLSLLFGVGSPAQAQLPAVRVTANPAPPTKLAVNQNSTLTLTANNPSNLSPNQELTYFGPYYKWFVNGQLGGSSSIGATVAPSSSNPAQLTLQFPTSGTFSISVTVQMTYYTKTSQTPPQQSAQVYNGGLPTFSVTVAPQAQHLYADQITDTSAHLYWDRQSSPDSNFSSYQLFRYPAALASGQPAATDTPIFSTTDPSVWQMAPNDSGLKADTDYYYYLKVNYKSGSPTYAPRQIHTLKSPTPQVDFSNITLRACAGHIQNTVHEVTITAPVNKKDTNGSVTHPGGLAFTLSFDGNTGTNPAQFVTTDPTTGNTVLQNTITVTSVASQNPGNDGKVSFTVLSSDQISNSIKVKAQWTDTSTNPAGLPQDAGSLACDFGAVVSKRMFGLVLFPSEDYDKDTGWSFYKTSSSGDSDANILYTPDSGGSPYTGLYKGKIFLKFPKDPSHKPGTSYFDSSFTPTATEASPLEPGWFIPVQGHQLQITLGTTQPAQPFTSAPKSEATMFFCDPTGKPLGGGGTMPPSNSLQTTVTTGSDGAGVFYFKAGPQLMQSQEIHFQVKELTQKQ